jgi:hypothetical protein
VILLNFLSYFFTKYKQIVRKINRYKEQYKKVQDNLIPFCSFVRLRIPVMESDSYIVLGPFLLTGIVQNQTFKTFKKE